MHYDAILVVGRGISKEGVLPASSVKSVAVAKDLLNQGLAPRVIFSGRWSRHFDFIPVRTEAEAMKSLALEQGVPEDKILIEDQSLDTVSNLYYVKKRFLIPNHWNKILLLILHQEDQRAPLMAKYILGPEYLVDTHSIDYVFPSDKQEYILATEKEKIRIINEFIRDRQIVAGDHERLFQEHAQFVKGRPIPPTYKS